MKFPVSDRIWIFFDLSQKGAVPFFMQFLLSGALPPRRPSSKVKIHVTCRLREKRGLDGVAGLGAPSLEPAHVEETLGFGNICTTAVSPNRRINMHLSIFQVIDSCRLRALPIRSYRIYIPVINGTRKWQTCRFVNRI